MLFLFPSFSMNFPPQARLCPRERGWGQKVPLHKESWEMLQFRNIFLRFTSLLASSYFEEYGDFLVIWHLSVLAGLLNTLQTIFFALTSELLCNNKATVCPCCVHNMYFCCLKTCVSGSKDKILGKKNIRYFSALSKHTSLSCEGSPQLEQECSHNEPLLSFISPTEM